MENWCTVPPRKMSEKYAGLSCAHCEKFNIVTFTAKKMLSKDQISIELYFS